MLPGGLSIIGLFICAPQEVFDRYANKLRDVRICYNLITRLNTVCITLDCQ